MPTELRVGLFEADPDLAGPLSPEEREQAERVRLQARQLNGDFDLASLLDSAQAFAALVYDGIVMHRIRLGEHETLRMLGPGDLLTVSSTGASMLIAETVYTAAADTKVALLDDRVLAAAQRWPRLFAAMVSKSAEQTERLTLQLAICQLPRVADRLLALMWLLADSWGRVTRSGVALPLALTHDALGAMIGARRPTVTLAIGELTERGAIVRQDRTWLLLEQQPELARAAPRAEAPGLIDWQSTRWSTGDLVSAHTMLWTHDELMTSIERLRSEHNANEERVSKRLAEARRTRERVAERRAQMYDRRVSRRPSP